MTENLPDYHDLQDKWAELMRNFPTFVHLVEAVSGNIQSILPSRFLWEPKAKNRALP